MRWIPQTNYPLNGPKDFLQRSYYIDFPLMRLIVLDTTDIMWLGAINSHKSWLRHVLSSSRQPWQVVLFHHAVDCVREGRKNFIMHHVFRMSSSTTGQTSSYRDTTTATHALRHEASVGILLPQPS